MTTFARIVQTGRERLHLITHHMLRGHLIGDGWRLLTRRWIPTAILAVTRFAGNVLGAIGVVDPCC